MENPRPEKVAVVAEVRERFEAADAALLTEYRGLNVKALADLRRQLRPAGGEYKVYKNTLVRFAARDLGAGELEALLTGPTAITFVKGDAAAVAKTLRDYARTNQNLVVKGGLLGGKVLSAADVQALADLPSRDVLLAQLAGAFQAPLVKLAGLLQALPRNFAYGLKALIDQGGPARRAVRARRMTAAERRRPPSGAATRPRRARTMRPRPEPKTAAEPVRRPPTPLTPAGGADHGHPHQGRDPRRHLRHDRPRAVRAALGVRGEVRRHRRRPGGRGRRRPPPVAAPRPPPPRRRTSSTSCSPPPARRRSRSSRWCASSPTSASRRPRTWSTPPPRPVLERASKDDADKAKAKLEEAGATVELK